MIKYITKYRLFVHKAIIMLTIIISSTQVAEAKRIKTRSCKGVAILQAAPPVPTSVVVDAHTGRVLHAQNPALKVYPASLTKVMTLYLAFEAIESGRLSMYEKLPVSANAARMRPSKLGLKAGETVMVRDLVLGLIVRSANDAAVVLAEGIAGTEEAFAQRMTKKARQMGMSDTMFRNASGWHHPEQKTTPVDLVKLTMAVKRDYPRFYPLFAQTSFVFKGKTIEGHNRVLRSYAGAEGLKTGYTTPAGYNLITIASREGRSLIAVVTGGKSAVSRDRQMVQLLDKHFGVVPKAILAGKTPGKTGLNTTKLASAKLNKLKGKIQQPVKVAARAGFKQKRRVRSRA